jgi:hypothetical protein
MCSLIDLGHGTDVIKSDLIRPRSTRLGLPIVELLIALTQSKASESFQHDSILSCHQQPSFVIVKLWIFLSNL